MLNVDPNVDQFSLADPPLAGRLDWGGQAFALEDGQREAYNEDAFKYFLEIERKRCEPWNRPLLLMLIELAPSPDAGSALNGATAAKFFSVVSGAVRETAFIGWYREGRVAGVVLTQHNDSDPQRTVEVVRERLARALAKHYGRDPRGRQVRMAQLLPHATWAD